VEAITPDIADLAAEQVAKAGKKEKNNEKNGANHVKDEENNEKSYNDDIRMMVQGGHDS